MKTRDFERRRWQTVPSVHTSDLHTAVVETTGSTEGRYSKQNTHNHSADRRPGGGGSSESPVLSGRQKAYLCSRTGVTQMIGWVLREVHRAGMD